MSKVLDLIFKLDVAVNNGFGETNKLTQSINQAAQAMQKLRQSAGKTGEYVNLAQKIRQNQETMLAMRNSARTLDSQIAGSRLNVQSLQSRYNALYTAQQKLIQSGQKKSETYSKVNERLKQVRLELKNAKSHTSELEREQNKLNSSADRLQRGLDSDRQKLASLRTELSAAGKSTQELTRAQEKQIQQAERIQTAYTKLNILKQQLNWNNIKGDLIKSMAMVNTLKAPVKIAMNFDSAMSSLNSVARLTKQEFNDMQKLAMDLGAKTQFTATEAAKTMEVLKRANFSNDQVQAAIASTLDMAAAEGLGLEQSADYIAAIIGGMNLKADEAGRVADVLGYTSAMARTNISLIAEVMKTAAPVGAGVNIKLEEMAAMIGTLANRGFNDSRAGTSLASTISRLNAIAVGSKKADAYQTLAKLGVPIHDKKGGMRKLTIILSEIAKATSKMEKGEQQGYLAKIFGKNHVPAMMALMAGVQAGETAKLEESFKNNKHVGWTAETARIRNDNLQGDLTKLSSAWEGFIIRIGKPLETLTRPLVQGLTDALTYLNDFADKNEGIFKTVTQIAGVFAGMKVAKSVLDFGFKIFEYAKTARELASAMHGVSDATRALGVASGAASVTTAALAWQLMAIAGALYLIYVNWDKIKDVFGKMGNIITSDPVFTSHNLKSADPVERNIAAMNLSGGPETLFQNTGPRVDPSLYTPKPGKKWGQPEAKHAAGGIFSSPHLGLVAEAGPEAIIPLNNKSRGTSLLFQAANKLGLGDLFITQKFANERQNSPNIDIFSSSLPQNSFINTQSNKNFNSSPVINISVSANEIQDSKPENLADLIANKVRTILEQINSDQERLSYA